MNFVPTTQKASLRTGGYSQFAPHTLIWKFDFNVRNSTTFGLLDCGEEPTMSKQYNRDSTPLCYGGRGAKFERVSSRKTPLYQTKEQNEKN